MPIDFPPNPTIGDIFTATNGVTYVWNGTQWIVQSGGGGGGGGGAFLPLSGGTLTGTLTLAGNPILQLEAATKQYVDNSTGGPGGFVPEAPTDGQIYGRDGLTTSWIAVLTTTATVDGGVF